MRTGVRRISMRQLALAMVMGGLFVTSALADSPNNGKLSFSIGSDITTAYYFRGIVQETDGFIVQPYGEVGVTLFEGNGVITSVKATGGIWNSVHSEQTGASGDGADNWYEADLYGGASVGLFEKLDMGVAYIAYTSPNDAFATVQEVDFSFGFDDSDLLGPLALSPSATLAVETQNTAFGENEGVYLELGVEPGLTLGEGRSYPVSLSLPLTLGLGPDDYYEARGREDTFGYFDGGIVAAIPLALIPEEYGAWKASAGVHFLALGDNLASANNNDSFEAIGTWGLSFSY